MRKFLKRHIGQILVDGGFLSRQVLASALQEQLRTRERLGQILVRMGVVKAPAIKASLLVQKCLSNIDDAVKMAAGDRQMLGALLVESGRITGAELDRAIAEQHRTGGKLGEVLVSLGFVSQQQLRALLDFQANQAAHATSPFRLGELLVTTGDLSRKHLKAALAKQFKTQKKLGEVLVQEGYVSPSRIEYGIGLQKMLMHAVLVAIFSLGVAATGDAASVQLEWDASPDAAAVGYKVYYQADSPAEPFQGIGSAEGAAPIDVNALTSATITGLEPGHTYYFAVTAYDEAGVESIYSNVVSKELASPSTSITNPPHNATVSGTVTVTADALNNPSVSGMRFFLNGTLLASDTSAPYEYVWDTSGLAPGGYTLTATAYDQTSNVTESGGLPVQVIALDVTAPSVILTAPLNGADVMGDTVISATASDDTGVSRVEFYEDGGLLYAGNSAPFTFNWDTASVANGAHVLVAKVYDAAGHVTQSSNISVTVNNAVPDNQAPVVNAFSVPASADSLNVAISSFAASDNVAVTGYLVTESATAPSASAEGWSATPQSSFTFSAAGARTAYAWTKDAAGHVSSGVSRSVTITLSDTAAPSVTSFTMPTTADSLTVVISVFTASDNVAVAGYLVTENGTAPPASASGWSATPPSWFTFSGTGVMTAYAWVKDATGNVSAVASRNVTITLPDAMAPVVSSFAIPITATSLNVAISSFAATDNVRVAGYLVTEIAIPPAASDAGWSTTIPSSFTFSAAGTTTAYAWTKDAAGNVSVGVGRTVSITLPDTAPPTVGSFVMPATSESLTVAISSLLATDSVGVAGYLVTESAAAPAAAASAWSTSPPHSFTFSAAGARTAYAWAKDVAGNVSAATVRDVSITLPSAATPPPPTEEITLTVSDALTALNIAAGKSAPTKEEKARLDVGPYVGGKSAPDGKVNTGDVVVILSKITGKDPAKR